MSNNRTIEAVTSRVQHCLLSHDESDGQVEQLIREAIEYNFQAVVVHPVWVERAVARLKGTDTNVCTYADFPIGGEISDVVVHSVNHVRELGADEVDITAKVGWLRSGMYDEIRQHYRDVVNAAGPMTVKVIMEVGLLSEKEFNDVVELCVESGVDYIKNATGYQGGDCTPELTAKMAAAASGRIKVKAAGEIYTAEEAFRHIDAGADVFGITAGVQLAQDVIAKIRDGKL